MRITNWHHIEAPLLPPDDSEVIAAESAYILNSIADCRKHLDSAHIAAGAENIGKAKEHIQMVMDVLSELVED